MLARPLVWSSLALWSLASSARADGGPVLHEYLPLGDLVCEGGNCRRDPLGHGDADRGNPDAIVSGSTRIAEPIAPARSIDNEPVFTPRSDEPRVVGGEHAPPVARDLPPERRDGVRMDRDTGPEPPGEHVYHEVFDPAVFPFKRMTALDAVAEDETLIVSDKSLRTMPLYGAGARLAARDAFWGSIVIDTAPGKWVPLPSVAADVRVLSYRSEPPAQLELARDGADSVYARLSSSDGTVRGLHRLVWLEDAPREYFAGPVPSSARFDRIPPALIHALPPTVQAHAEQVLRALHIDRAAAQGQPIVKTLDTLVQWFRGFETGELTEHSDSRYLDIALHRRGSCRHRAFAFVITALALGLPARYIENELHVYVEVWLPGVEWRRIDLGGALVAGDTEGMAGKTPYAPAGGDPFPQPREFRASGSEGMSAGGAPLLDVRGAPGEGGAGAAAGAGVGAGQSVTSVRISDLKIDRASAFRGESVEVRGRFSPLVSGARISIVLEGEGALHVPLGDATMHDDGSFDARVKLPATLPLGSYRVTARVN